VSETGMETSSPGGGLYDDAGRPIQSGPSQETTEELIRFVKEHPVGTALGALALGYILGKIF
jgi:hypothetical protein